MRNTAVNATATDTAVSSAELNTILMSTGIARACTISSKASPTISAEPMVMARRLSIIRWVSMLNPARITKPAVKNTAAPCTDSGMSNSSGGPNGSSPSTIHMAPTPRATFGDDTPLAATMPTLPELLLTGIEPSNPAMMLPSPSATPPAAMVRVLGRFQFWSDTWWLATTSPATRRKLASAPIMKPGR